MRLITSSRRFVGKAFLDDFNYLLSVRVLEYIKRLVVNLNMKYYLTFLSRLKT